jgi:hypothetical protein
MLDERRLRELIENRTMNVGGEDYQLRLVGFSETPNKAVMLAIAIGGADERLHLQLSDDLRGDPIAVRQRVVYFARRIVMTMRLCAPHTAAMSPASDLGEESSRILR